VFVVAVVLAVVRCHSLSSSAMPDKNHLTQAKEISKARVMKATTKKIPPILQLRAKNNA